MWVFFNVSEYSDDPRVNSLRPSLPDQRPGGAAFHRDTGADSQRNQHHPPHEPAQRPQGGHPGGADLRLPRLHPQLAPADYTWLHTKLHGRLAAPWTCLVVVVIAIPFGAASGRRNVFFGVAGSVFICFAYFILLQLGLALGTGGYLPPWVAAWFPTSRLASPVSG